MPMTVALLLLASQLPAEGTQVIPPDSLTLRGNVECGTMERVPVDGQPFKTAIRVETKVVPGNPWEFEAGADSSAAVKQGDVMLASVYVRAIKGQPETGEGRTTLDFQVNGTWTKSIEQSIPITKTWRRIDIPFVAKYDSAAGGASVAFRLGYGIQTVEIGGLSIMDFENRARLKDLPRTAATYAGEEADAPWRVAALKRIEKLRKGPLVIKIVDAAGKPVSGVPVHVRMTQQAFPFGTAVAADRLFDKGPDGDKYRAHIISDFNRATIENNLKWPYWEIWGRADGIKAVDWLNEKGIPVRAHNVIWPSWRNTPKDLPGLSKDALVKRINDHIDEEVGTFKGKVDLWDVVNEPFDNHDILDILGKPVMADWFKRVHSLDGKPKLVLNDYPPLDGAASSNAHLNSFYNNLSDLLKEGAPIDQIGFQCHIGGDVIPPERILSGLDRFAKLGLPIEITEFDINTSDREMQANYMRDFLIACFSHPSVAGITQWGFWADRHWLPDGALFDKDWTLRPHGKVYLDLIKKTWSTDASGKTVKDGTFKANAFYGDYDLVVKDRTYPIVFAKGTTSITVRM